MIGSSIGNYVVCAKIGEGGMGVVYLAEHPHIGRRVAIKVLQPEHSQDPRTVARFSNEARAAYEVRNEHIVEILDFGELPDGSPYFVMEWLDGRTLATVLEEEPRLPLERVLHVTLGIAEALAAAHDSGVVHRDLKPGNIVLIDRGDDPDFVKVVDFGVAKLLSGHKRSPELRTTTRTVLGTWAYMAPEQCRGENDRVDARSDIYALGVVLYEMATGRLPFLAEGTGMLLAHIGQTPPPPRTIAPELPETVEAVILRALEKEPEQRFQSVDDLVMALTGTPLPPRKPRPRTPYPPSTAPETPVRATPRDHAGKITAPLRPKGATPRTPPGNLGGGTAALMPVPPEDRADDTARFPLAQILEPAAPAAEPPVARSGPGLPDGRPGPSRSPRRGLLLGGTMILALAVLAGLSVTSWHRPTSALTTPPPPAGPALPPHPSAVTAPPPALPKPPGPPTAIRLRVRTIPATAQLLLDGAELANPFTGTFDRGDTRHLLVARSHEHRDQSTWVIFDHDQELTLVLQPLPPGKHAASRPSGGSAKSPPAAPAPAPPSEPDRGKRSKPKIITDFPG
ncbi:MAG TPA: serine/threonine-protein kinase [Polyangia bacterium]|nr:serine/threonine-protein kinase [Polyangia bacterium]